MACIDASSGNFVVFNETTSQPNKAIISSASVPFGFPPQDWEDGVVCIDSGMTAWNDNLVSAAERCRQQVDEDSEITIDILVTTPYFLHNDTTKLDNALSNMLRHQNIRKYFRLHDDVYEFKRAFPDINFRYFIQPNATLPEGEGIREMEFNNKTTFKMQLAGRKTGAFHYHVGEGFFFKKMDEWRDSRS